MSNTDQPASLAVPTDAELGAEMVEKLKTHPPLNIQRYLALAPECFDGWQSLLGGIYASGLDPRLRETVICRVGARTACAYELFQHEVLAGQNGVSAADLQAILHEDPVTSLDAEAQLLCRVVDELTAGGPMSDATYAEFVTRYDSHTAMRWLVLIGHYACVVRVLNGARVPLESSSPLAGQGSPLG